MAYAKMSLAFWMALSNSWWLGEVRANSLESSSLRAPVRTLQEASSDAITLLEPGEEVHVVRISQSVIGAGEVCDGRVSKADIMFAIFLDPDTLEETCGFFKRDVSPCFQETLAIGCDPLTQTAKIDLYIRDRSLPGSMREDNPKLGRCKVGNGKVARKTILISETFDCNGELHGNKGPGTCSDTHDECFEGSYCNFSEVNGYECKSYVPVGASCGGFTLPGEDNRCNPAEAYCRDTEYCILADVPGTCAAYFGECESDDDCDDTVAHFCDLGVKQCKERLVEGDCCAGFGANSCENGLICPQNEDGGLEWNAQCVSQGLVCDPPCTKDEECAFSEGSGESFCRPYLSPGDTCGLFGIPGSVPNCNPNTAFCDFAQQCFEDSTATCVEYTSGFKKCADIADCATKDEWCDKSVGRCKPRVEEDLCCEFVGQCQDGLTCVEVYIDDIVGAQKVCRPACSGDEDCPEGQWCSGSNAFDPSFCKPFVGEGDACEFFTLESLYERCDPSIHFCFDSLYCLIADGGGKCTPLGATCRETADCDDPNSEYCDTEVFRCKPRLEEGACCKSNLGDQCTAGNECDGEVCGPPGGGVCNNEFCGGFAGFECACACTSKGDVPMCIDDPEDECDPLNGGADCGGICVCGRPEV